MPRRRPTLRPLAPTLRAEDEGTWMLTFSDLVLLLLAFAAIGILTERARGPHVVTDRLEARRPAPVGPADEAPFTLVEPPAATTAPVAHAVDEGPAAIDPRLRALAARLETRLAAEGIPGLRPIVFDARGISVEIGTAHPPADAVAARPHIAPARVSVVDAVTVDPAPARARALARAARLAHEVIGGDPLLAVHTVDGRLEVRLAG